MTPIVLLPGLDGTGQLLAPLVETAPAHLRPIVIALPQLASYQELLDAIRPQLPSGRFAILGESFSGPLAVALARAEPDRVRAVILCNSFVSPPLTPLLRFFPWSLLFVLPPPRWAIRCFFLGRDSTPSLVSSVRAVTASTPRRVLAARMRAVFTLPPARRFAPLDTPLLLLSGTEDVLVSPDTRVLERAATHFVHKRIAGPHLLLQTSPEAAWREIAAFIEVCAR